EEVLRAAGLPDDDSTQEAEDALEDEGLGPRRRARPAPDAVVPRALAAKGDAGAAWIATSSGIFRGDENGCRPAGRDGLSPLVVDLLVVAAAGMTVAAATDDLLFRRGSAAVGDDAGDPDDAPANDDTATFTVAAGLASRPRALAVWSDGTPLVADDDGVVAFA